MLKHVTNWSGAQAWAIDARTLDPCETDGSPPWWYSLLFVCPTYSLHKVSTVTALCTRPNWCSVLTDTLAATVFWGSCVQAASMGGVLACHGPHNVSAMHEDIGQPTYSQCLSQRVTQLPDWVLLNPKKWL